MNPAVAAQQIRTAAAARRRAAVARQAAAAIRARVARVAYSTQTGDAPRPSPWGEETTLPHEEAHCFVCGRHTDHFAEHDAYVVRGLATQDSYSGSVYRTDLWEARPDLVEEARAEVEAEVQAWLAQAV